MKQEANNIAGKIWRENNGNTGRLAGSKRPKTFAFLKLFKFVSLLFARNMSFLQKDNIAIQMIQLLNNFERFAGGTKSAYINWENFEPIHFKV